MSVATGMASFVLSKLVDPYADAYLKFPIPGASVCIVAMHPGGGWLTHDRKWIIDYGDDGKMPVFWAGARHARRALIEAKIDALCERHNTLTREQARGWLVANSAKEGGAK